MTDEYAIDARHLSKSFGTIQAVKDISIQLKKGRIFGFLGPNGSGKTTTIRMLCGLLTPDQGEGTCLGFDLRKQRDLIKSHVGYMTQRFSLYEDLTVQENLELVTRLYQISPLKETVENLMNSLGLMVYRNQLVQGLSGGWKQRLSLAAAIIHDPEILLLDEPTSGVDPQARRSFWEFIHRLSDKGTTVLVSTHYMDEVDRCHEIAYISQGKLLTQGAVDEVLTQSGLTTWEVMGENINALADQIKDLPGVEHLTFLGGSLRLSTFAEKEFLKSMAPYRKKRQYKWHQTSPSAEDLFIALAGGT